MCRSPHELTTTEVEGMVQQIDRVLKRSGDNMTQKLKATYEWRLQEYENILKERAEQEVI